ncbi:MAG: hypothetical protein NTX71_10110 [Candidatus Aureabacteria bacterium]|jgi:uncharacterized protein YprB with RNaseH-like and TPR domain|nr:hypothetical protein [Candidatus Auribacterota bacterium]
MSWDEDAARKAVKEFHALLAKLETEHPECIRQLRETWKKQYLHCGHKRLGRIVLGYSPEEACKGRAGAE